MRKFGKRTVALTAFILLQIIVLLGLALSNTAIERFGKEIRLETAPVDPRDLFYGDYVVLHYAISQLPREMWQDDRLPVEGERVYVRLRAAEQRDGIYEPVSVSGKRPDVAADEAVLRARVRTTWDNQLRLEYGLERYYVPEGTGKQLEAQYEGMQVAVKVSSRGQAVISKLIVKE
ncbi:hypothetical protein EBB07_11035 [Paenibacillaceae bacterium]|nr:hypothetical protein EBB07_11035 [Paenibacillaceae bacterium]